MKDANIRLVYDEGLSGGRAESPGVQLLLPCRVDGLLEPGPFEISAPFAFSDTTRFVDREFGT